MNTSLLINLLTLLIWLPLALGIGRYVWTNDLLDKEAWTTGPVLVALYLLTVVFVGRLRRVVRGVTTLFLVYSPRDLLWDMPVVFRHFANLLRWAGPSSDYHWRPGLLTDADPRVALLAAHVNAGERVFPPEELFGLARLASTVGRRPVRHALRSIYDLSPRENRDPAWMSVYSGDPRFGNSFRSKDSLILFAGEKSLSIDVAEHREAALLLCELDA